MRHLLPTRAMIAVFAVMALACGALASLSHAHDIAMAGFAVPIFAFSAWMGMRGSGQWASLSRPATGIEAGESRMSHASSKENSR